MACANSFYKKIGDYLCSRLKKMNTDETNSNGRFETAISYHK